MCAFKRGLAYTGVAQPIPPDQVISDRSPTAKDYQSFNIGDRWIVPTSATAPSEQEWILMSKAQNQAVWVQVNAAGATTYNDHEVLVGTGTATINTINNSTAGLPLLTQGAGADPSYGVLAVPAGGTAKTSFTAYAPILGGTTATGALQSVAALGAAGTVLTSNGAGAAATFQAPFLGVVPVPNGGTGDTTVAAYQVVCGGVTNVDPLQTVGSLGTLNQVLSSNGVGALPSWKNNSSATTINIQTFTAGAGTYTPTGNMQYCIVECVGAGGGSGGMGGAARAGDKNTIGGGGGAYCKRSFSAATIGVSQNLVVGVGGAGGVGDNNGVAGGNTTFGTVVLMTAGGGGGGPKYLGAPGPSLGGIATGGDININGQSSSVNSNYSNLNILGGNSMMGLSPVLSHSSAISGSTGVGYGAAANGCYDFSGAAGALNGGSGTSGFIIVTEYIGA